MIAISNAAAAKAGPAYLLGMPAGEMERQEQRELGGLRPRWSQQEQPSSHVSLPGNSTALLIFWAHTKLSTACPAPCWGSLSSSPVCRFGCHAVSRTEREHPKEGCQGGQGSGGHKGQLRASHLAHAGTLTQPSAVVFKQNSSHQCSV